VRRQDFAYDLPAELIAQEPPAERSAGRLLVLEATTGAVTDSLVRELAAYLRGGDLLVLNDTRVVPARAFGRKPSGGRVEIFLERALEGDEALVQLAASKAIAAGLRITTEAGPVQVLGKTEGLWRVRLPSEALQFFERCGQVPLPPYIHRPPAPADRERYQSIFARQPGAVAAPTASLHFDEALTQALRAQGVHTARITLHVGAGTFQPLRVDEIERHVMHPERVSIGREACEAIARTRARGGRVVAIGTTVVRALETAARALPGAAGTLAPFEGETRLFITPGFQFQVTDMLLTNFHLPESTLLMLVCAFAGQQRVLAAYRHAVTARYRFFSYGDAMLLTRSAA
jgi:S-adenosylmethionine:tRNA ribosyltransferase-isomerase